MWLEAIRKLPERDGLFCLGDTSLSSAWRWRTSSRVHHLILVPDLSKAEEL